MHNLDLKRMQVFVAVVESGGLTAAQNRLGLTCPAISKYIADLEVRLGHTLCKRGRNGFLLTEAGETYYQLAKSLQEELNQHQKQVQTSLSQLHKEPLRLGCVDNLVFDQRNRFLKSMLLLLHDMPQYQLEPNVLSSDQIFDGLLSEKLDLGLSFLPGSVAEIHSQFLHEEKIVAVVAPHHPLAAHSEGNVDIAELNQHRVISFKSQLVANLEGEEVLENIEEIIWCVHLAASVGIVPEHVVRASLQSGELLALHIEDWLTTSSVYLLCRKSRLKHAFYDALFSKVAQEFV